MDRKQPPSKEDPTSSGDDVNKNLPHSRPGETPQDGNEEPSSSSGVTLSRRSLLSAVGVTAASMAGCVGDSSKGAELSSFTAYGFGGTPIMTQSTQSVTESESNDRQATAMPVELGSVISGSLTQNDSDYYSVTLSSGEELTIEFDRTAETGMTAVIVFEPDGDLGNLRYVPSDDPLVFTETAEMSGTHYVQVVDTQNSATDYSLALTSTGGSTDTPTATETPTETETTTPSETTTPVDDYGQQGYGQYGYGGIALDA